MDLTHQLSVNVDPQSREPPVLGSLSLYACHCGSRSTFLLLSMLVACRCGPGQPRIGVPTFTQLQHGIHVHQQQHAALDVTPQRTHGGVSPIQTSQLLPPYGGPFVRWVVRKTHLEGHVSRSTRRKFLRCDLANSRHELINCITE